MNKNPERFHCSTEKNTEAMTSKEDIWSWCLIANENSELKNQKGTQSIQAAANTHRNKAGIKKIID